MLLLSNNSVSSSLISVEQERTFGTLSRDSNVSSPLTIDNTRATLTLVDKGYFTSS